MARAIDVVQVKAEIAAEKLAVIIENGSVLLKDMQSGEAVKIATLTTPNEPLTLEELREMEQSTPVWWDYIPCWVLVRRGSVLVFGSEPHKVENLFGYFYRRPPEGEGDGAK